MNMLESTPTLKVKLFCTCKRRKLIEVKISCFFVKKLVALYMRFRYYDVTYDVINETKQHMNELYWTFNKVENNLV